VPHKYDLTTKHTKGETKGEGISRKDAKSAKAKRLEKKVFCACLASWRDDLNFVLFVTFVLFVVINFLTTKDTKHTKENAKEEGVP
jgi:hypothetical protein